MSTVQMDSTTHHSRKAASLKMAPSVGMVGRTYIPGWSRVVGGSEERLIACVSGSWVNQRSCPLDVLLQYLLWELHSFVIRLECNVKELGQLLAWNLRAFQIWFPAKTARDSGKRAELPAAWLLMVGLEVPDLMELTDLNQTFIKETHTQFKVPGE